MLCSDTGHTKAIHFEHTDLETVGNVDRIIGMLKQLCKGNGRLTLNLQGGSVMDIDVSMKAPNTKRKSA